MQTLYTPTLRLIRSLTRATVFVQRGIYHWPVFDCRDVMTDQSTPSSAYNSPSVRRMYDILHEPFREIRMQDYERSLCESHPTTLQIHDHSNVSWCQSSCINIIRWPSFNYDEGIRCSPSRARTVFATYRRAYSIQYGYYRTRYTRCDLSGHDRWISIFRNIYLPPVSTWKNLHLDTVSR